MKIGRNSPTDIFFQTTEIRYKMEKFIFMMKKDYLYLLKNISIIRMF